MPESDAIGDNAARNSETYARLQAIEIKKNFLCLWR
jgi:hypothetical protein